jgi:hypothetical protein
MRSDRREAEGVEESAVAFRYFRIAATRNPKTRVVILTLSAQMGKALRFPAVP